jgi:citronellyl-CoA dehydrogenase
MWITNAFQADWMCLLANTSEGQPHRNKSLICLPMDTPGINLAKKIDKMGMKCSDTAVIYFEDVRVPAKNIIGKEGMGFTYQMMQFQEERLAATAISLTPMEGTINDTIAYTRSAPILFSPVSRTIPLFPPPTHPLQGEEGVWTSTSGQSVHPFPAGRAAHRGGDTVSLI